MFAKPTNSPQSHPESQLALLSKPNSGIGGQDTTSDGQSQSASFHSDERILHKLDELFAGVENRDERGRLLSKAIRHLQQMQAQISQDE